jgi:hypothetical protein
VFKAILDEKAVKTPNRGLVEVFGFETGFQTQI